jgi:hypothetical protein
MQAGVIRFNYSDIPISLLRGGQSRYRQPRARPDRTGLTTDKAQMPALRPDHAVAARMSEYPALDLALVALEIRALKRSNSPAGSRCHESRAFIRVAA